jgi:WhiB family redox-sensing transcriptional regulator
MSERVSWMARLFAVEAENDWRPEAACLGLDPELFFSSDEIVNRQERLEREAEAKAVCTRCTVRTECLNYAIDAGERYGIWGGLSPQERRALGRSRPGSAAAEQVS